MTEILFWDGPEKGIATYKYQTEAEFVNCDCCFVDPIPRVCLTGKKQITALNGVELWFSCPCFLEKHM